MPEQDPLSLSLSQSFERERFGRAIEECNDVAQLRKIAGQLLDAYFTQKAATQWVMRQSLSRPATISPGAVSSFGFQTTP